MKILIGKPGKGFKQFDKAETANKGVIEAAVRDSIMGAIQQDSTRMSIYRFGQLVAKIQVAAETEALRIFQKAITIINNSKSQPLSRIFGWHNLQERTAFTGDDLGTASRRAAIDGLSQTGSVNWRDLTASWMKHKQRHAPANARKFFKFSGSLASTLGTKSYQTAWIQRFGGVKVTARAPSGLNAQRPLTTVSSQWVLGEIDVAIFPNIPFILLPMLASSRWTDDTGGSFERSFFNGKMAEKLAGPAGWHRPLIQPLVQFWMAFRIPAVIQQAINTKLGQP